MPWRIRVAGGAELDRSAELCDMLATQVHDLSFVPMLACHLITADRCCGAKPLCSRFLRADTAENGLSATIILATEDVAPFSQDGKGRVVLLQDAASAFRGNLPYGLRNLLTHHSPQPMNL